MSTSSQHPPPEDTPPSAQQKSSARKALLDEGLAVRRAVTGPAHVERSLLNLAMLVALGKGQELGVHVRGAVRNGVTEGEIQEAIMQASMYAGLPAGLEGFRVAERALEEMKGERTAS